MSITNKHVYAGAPNTERGRPTSLRATPSKFGNKMIYGSGTNVVIRDLDNPLICEYYTGHSHKVTAAAYSPSGYYVCSGDENGFIRIWATDNVDRTLKLEIQPLSGAIRDIAWTPDSQRVVIVGEGKGTYAHVFLWDSGSPVGEISGHSKEILTCDMRGDRPFRIVTGGEDMSVNFYKGPPFKFSHSHKDVHTNFVNCVRFSPNNEFFVSVSSDKTGHVYEGKEGTKIGALQGHKATVYSATWSSDSKKIVTASSDKSVKIWSTDDRSCVHTLELGKNIEDQQVGITRVGESAVSVSLNGTLNIIDINNGTLQKNIAGHNNKIYQLVYGADKTFYSSGADGVIIEWQYGQGPTRRVSGKGHTGAVVGMKLIPAASQLVTASVNNSVRYVDVNSFAYVGEEVKLSGSPSDLAVHDQTVLVVTHKGVSVIRNQQLVNEQTGFGFDVTSVTISNDGSSVVLGGSDKKARLYSFNGQQLTEVASFGDAHRGRITKVSFSPDSSLVAVGDANREIIVYNVADRSVKYNGLVFHTSQITDLQWSSNGEFLASSAVEKNVIVWNLKEGKRAITDIAHLSGVTSVAFVGSEENTILTAGNDFAIKAWQFSF